MRDEQALSSPLLATKFQPPPLRADLVRRLRLLQKLSPAAGIRVTLISAPAGSGKSTLLRQWCAAAGRSVAWLSLDPRDNTLHRFLRYFIAALRQVDVGIGADGAELSASLTPDAVESLLTTLINTVAVTPKPFSLILDDYHLIADTRIHQALRFLIENLPPSLHLLIATRADPPWPLARLRARRELVEIRGNDLRFTSAEVATLLNDVLGLGLRPELLAALETRTEGWIAGLQLAALALQGAGDERRQLLAQRLVDDFSTGHHFVLDYLTEEVLDQQPASLRTFLLQTSLLERMCGSLCDALTGSTDGTERLCRLEQSNAFIVPLDTEGRWYRYHHLFAALLRRRLQQSRAAEIPKLYRRASLWFEEQDLIEEAVAYALEGQELARVAQLVEKYGMRFIAGGERASVAEWLEAIPESLVERRPRLCVFRAAMAHWTGERDCVICYLRRAERLLAGAAEAEDNRYLLGYIASIRAHDSLTSGEIVAARLEAERAVTHLPHGDVIHSDAAMALGGAYWALGDVAASEGAFSEAYSSAIAGGHHHYAVIPAGYVALQQIKQGRLRQAYRTCRHAWDFGLGPTGQPLPVAGFISLRLGDLQREWNHLEEAERTLRQGLALCRRLNQVDILADGHVMMARLQLAVGDLEGVVQNVAAAEQLVTQTAVDRFVISWLEGVRLRLWLAAGDLETALHWASTSGLHVDGELSYYYDLHHIHLARLLLARAEAEGRASFLDDALGILVRLKRAAVAAGWVHETIQILLLQAHGLCCHERDDDALAAVTEALRLAEPGSYQRTFIDEGPLVAQLLQCTVAKDVSPAYVRRLLAPSGSATATVAVEGRRSDTGLVEGLSERELEVLRFLPGHLNSVEIAEELTISANTVRTHIKNIYGKLDVHSRGEAVERARELNILP